MILRLIAIAAVCASLAIFAGLYFINPAISHVRKAFDSAAREAVADIIKSGDFIITSEGCDIVFPDAVPYSVSAPGCRVLVRGGARP